MSHAPCGLASTACVRGRDGSDERREDGRRRGVHGRTQDVSRARSGESSREPWTGPSTVVGSQPAVSLRVDAVANPRRWRAGLVL